MRYRMTGMIRTDKIDTKHWAANRTFVLSCLHYLQHAFAGMNAYQPGYHGELNFKTDFVEYIRRFELRDA
jgi:hypothetical protein